MMEITVMINTKVKIMEMDNQIMDTAVMVNNTKVVIITDHKMIIQINADK